MVITLEANDFLTPTQQITNKVEYIKMSMVDANGNETRDHISTQRIM